MNTDTLLIFAVASFGLALTPGPTMLLALSNGMAGGMRAAAWGIVGATVGASALVAVVAFGLGALLAASEWLFEVLRAGGVAYLAWIGWRMWRTPPLDLRAALAAAGGGTLRGRRAFARSLTVALSNPKTLLFFAAFLPQFVDPARPAAGQYAVLGSLFVGIDALVMLAYAGAGAQALRWLSARSLKAIHRGCAVGMWLLALMLAAWRRPAA